MRQNVDMHLIDIHLTGINAVNEQLWLIYFSKIGITIALMFHTYADTDLIDYSLVRYFDNSRYGSLLYHFFKSEMNRKKRRVKRKAKRKTHCVQNVFILIFRTAVYHTETTWTLCYINYRKSYFFFLHVTEVTKEKVEVHALCNGIYYCRRENMKRFL